jgi:nicotinamide phosphoribosyltransferase
MLQLIKPFNIILAADSYKAGHYLEIPESTEYTYSAVVPRKPSNFSGEIVAMGQTFIAYILANVRVTEAMIDEAEIEITEQGYRFNRKGWEIIARELGGRLPLAMYGVEEGRVVKPQTPVIGFINTDRRFAWLPAYVETWAQDATWTMSSNASIARAAKKMIKGYMIETGTELTMLDYTLHNFGDRAAGSPEEGAVLAGIAHAALFSGSDCLRANGYIKKLYRTSKPYLSSVEAFEHSTICANSDAEKKDDFGAAKVAVERLKDVVALAKSGIGIPLMSVVIDTYDDARFVGEYLGGVFKDEIVNSGGRMVSRPDSGDPTVQPGIIGNILKDKFGFTVNAKGFNVLAPCVGVLQGDGIRLSTMDSVLRGWVNAGFSIDNFVLGMGTGTTNDCQRDDFSWSMKAIANCVGGTWKRLLKDPVTDPGKKSLSGLIRCREDSEGNLETYDALADNSVFSFEHSTPGWRCWYKDGFQEWRQTFDELKIWAGKGI